MSRPRASTSARPIPEKAAQQVKEQKEGRRESQAGDEKGGQRQAQVKSLWASLEDWVAAKGNGRMPGSLCMAGQSLVHTLRRAVWLL